ncbi:MAG TPA: hypothetical protein VLF91_03045 [Candidatus Saccharimonadales bacterium]|nr:hypothetical protein [Candidatus Saccharimonadales bacterium]
MIAGIVIVTVVILVSVSLGARLYIKRNRRSAEAWEGMVTDKAKRSTAGKSTRRYIRVKLPNGETKTLHLHGKLWREFSIGDSVVKRAGKYNPDKA